MIYICIVLSVVSLGICLYLCNVARDILADDMKMIDEFRDYLDSTADFMTKASKYSIEANARVIGFDTRLSYLEVANRLRFEGMSEAGIKKYLENMDKTLGREVMKE